MIECLFLSQKAVVLIQPKSATDMDLARFFLGGDSFSFAAAGLASSPPSFPVSAPAAALALLRDTVPAVVKGATQSIQSTCRSSMARSASRLRGTDDHGWRLRLRPPAAAAPGTVPRGAPREKREGRFCCSAPSAAAAASRRIRCSGRRPAGPGEAPASWQRIIFLRGGSSSSSCIGERGGEGFLAIVCGGGGDRFLAAAAAAGVNAVV
mmetsp:Transcript_19724/g.37083  ORF Transcript_19724/g.37083 Transcript_19724/m.37083 type:complete len:209 (+) Transcript_19724:1025-1651(+)